MKTTDDALTDYCELLIRHIASRMLDPHRYFEQKLLGQLALAEAPSAQLEIFKRLLAWTRPGKLLDAAQAEELDALLAERALPSATLAHAHPELIAKLLLGAIASAQLQQLLANGGLGKADQRVVRACLAADQP